MPAAVLALVLALLAVGGPGADRGPAPDPGLRTASVTDPLPPTNVVATGADRALAISWTAPGEVSISGYQVFLDGVLVASPTTTSVTVSGLTNGRTHVVTVRTRTTFVGTTYTGTTASTPVDGIPRDGVAPAAPATLSAAPADRQMGLSWPAGGEYDVAGYELSRDGVLLATVTGTGYTDSGLVNGTTYGYSLVVVDTSGNRSSATTTTAVPRDSVVPAAPAALSAAPGDRQLVLSWPAGGDYDVTAYELSRDGVLLATVTGTGYTDSGLVNGTSYGYSLVALDTSGNRSAATTTTAVPRDSVAPAAPAALSTAPGDREVVLSWPAGGEYDVAGYELSRDGVLIATVTSTDYTDSGLVNGTSYGYSLVVVDTSGNRSAPTTTAVVPRDADAPLDPTALTASPDDRQVVLSWPAGGEYDVAGYELSRDGVLIATVTGTGYTDSGLVNGTSYGYSLVVVDTSGNRSGAATATAVPRDAVDPASVPALTASPDDRQVVLSWPAGGEYDVAGYELSRDGVLIATVTGTDYTDSGLVNGTSYGYSLVVVDTSENRSAPATATVIPRDTVAPAVPAPPTATPDDGQVSLSWPAGGEYDVAAHELFRDGVLVATLTSSTHVDTGLQNGSSYGYTLVAVDTSGNRSAPSAVTTAVPRDGVAPAAPAELTATADDRQVTLVWPATGDSDLRHYELSRDGVLIATVTGTGYTDTGLVNGATHTYALVAVDTSDNRSAPTTATAVPRDAVPPAAPSGLTATPGDSQVWLSWTANAEADLEHYELSRDGVLIATVTGTGYTDSGLVNGTAYSYSLVAVDTSDNRSTASTAGATPVLGTVPAEGAGETGGVTVSSTGRYVVIGTRARLEPSDTNAAYELYLFDRTAGTRTRIAPLPASATGAGDPTNAAAPAISDDGRYVVLATTAALVPTDTNRLADVYRRDVVAGTWALVSVPPSGAVSPGTAGTQLQTGASVYSTSPSVAVSADGALVLFYSARADLVAGDTNGVVDVFAKNMTTGAVTRVSATATGANLPRTALGPALALTPDGRYALFPATSANGPTVLYRKTLSGAGAGEAVVVSAVVVAGRRTEFAVFRDAGDVAISDDGRYVALVTAARLGTSTPSATGSAGLAHRVDTLTGTSVAMGNGQASVWEHQVELDPSGRYGFFSTSAAELPGDGNGHTDHYRRDLDGGSLVLVTAGSDGRATGGVTGSVTPAEYGRLFAVGPDRVLVTTSQALLATDANGRRDLYAKDLADGRVASVVG